MRRTHRTLIMLALGLALVGGTTAAAAATQSDERRALYESELSRTSGCATSAPPRPSLRPTPPWTWSPPSCSAWSAVPRPWSAGPP
jgi:hypothetical protein